MHQAAAAPPRAAWAPICPALAPPPRRQLAHVARRPRPCRFTARAAANGDADPPSARPAPHEAELRAAQASDVAGVMSLDETKRLVDTAMLAAVGGLAYALGAVLRLQAYMSYLLPLPIVIAGGRWGPATGFKAAGATGLLVLVLLGPVQALTYAFNYGAPSAVLGACWASRAPWPAALAAGAAARVAGVAAYVALSSWTLGEDLLQLLLANVCALLDQMAALLGAAGAPPPAAVAATLASVLAVNATAHVAVLHVVLGAALRAVGVPPPRVPAWLARRFGGRGWGE